MEDKNIPDLSLNLSDVENEVKIFNVNKIIDI